MATKKKVSKKAARPRKAKAVKTAKPAKKAAKRGRSPGKKSGPAPAVDMRVPDKAAHAFDLPNAQLHNEKSTRVDKGPRKPPKGGASAKAAAKSGRYVRG